MKHTGSCHCGDVRFEVEVDASKGTRCNCTICTKTAILGGMVKPSAFRLLTPESATSSYEFGGKVAKRFFCKRCGVQCYGAGHLAELGGDFVSINLNCLDDIDPSTVEVGYWDGRANNWEAGLRPAPWPIVQNAS
ncbi:MAG: GFA family protein [Deltaproteobacteria bacterium]|nr:GFA family protein [Deltaproteobacteria bacterium]